MVCRFGVSPLLFILLSIVQMELKKEELITSQLEIMFILRRPRYTTVDPGKIEGKKEKSSFLVASQIAFFPIFNFRCL